MKKFIVISILIALLIVSLSSCGKDYNENNYDVISKFVVANESSLNTKIENIHYLYDSSYTDTVKSYYGYYHTTKDAKKPYNTLSVKIDEDEYVEKHGGYYFGTVSEESDWAFVKKINERWYYFETHDYVNN